MQERAPSYDVFGVSVGLALVKSSSYGATVAPRCREKEDGVTRVQGEKQVDVTHTIAREARRKG